MTNPLPSAPPLPLHESLLGEDQKNKGESSGSDLHHHQEPYHTDRLSHGYHQHQQPEGCIDPRPHQYPVVGQPNPSPAVVFGFPAPPPQQPWPVVPAQHRLSPSRSRSRWTSGLCSCCADPEVCLIGCCCPCILFGRVASTLDQHDVAHDAYHDIDTSSCTSACLIWYVLQQFTGMGWIYSCAYRAKLQSRYGITPHHGTNCIVHLCCWHCAFCQEYREIKTRKRRERERPPVMVAPPPTQVMHY